MSESGEKTGHGRYEYEMSFFVICVHMYMFGYICVQLYVNECVDVVLLCVLHLLLSIINIEHFKGYYETNT